MCCRASLKQSRAAGKQSPTNLDYETRTDSSSVSAVRLVYPFAEQMVPVETPEKGRMPLETPVKALKLNRVPTPTSVASSTLSGLSSPTGSLSDRSAMLTVAVSVPDEVTSPVFFHVEVRYALTGDVWVVKRRYSQFDELAKQIRSNNTLICTPDLPPKLPPPGANRTLLMDRASGLQMWSSCLLQQPDALCDNVILDFFGLPYEDNNLTSKLLTAADLEGALLRLQAASRGFLVRCHSPSKEDVSAYYSKANSKANSKTPKRARAHGFASLVVVAIAFGAGAAYYHISPPALAPKPTMAPTMPPVLPLARPARGLRARVDLEKHWARILEHKATAPTTIQGPKFALIRRQWSRLINTVKRLPARLIKRDAGRA